MAVGPAHTLYCDRPGCRSQITLLHTRSADEARQVAHRRYGWRTGRRDLCPNEPAPAPLARAANYSHRPPYALERVIDRIHSAGDNQPMQHGLDWKAQHPALFPPLPAEVPAP